MDEILQQIAFVNAMNDAWSSVNDSALRVLKSIDHAVDVTIAKIEKLTEVVNRLSISIRYHNTSSKLVNTFSVENPIQRNTAATSKQSYSLAESETKQGTTRSTEQENERPEAVSVGKNSLTIANTLVGLAEVGKFLPEKYRGITESIKLASSLSDGKEGIEGFNKKPTLYGEVTNELKTTHAVTEILKLGNFLPGPFRSAAKVVGQIYGTTELNDGVNGLVGNETEGSKLQRNIDTFTNLGSGVVDLFGDEITAMITGIEGESVMGIAEVVAAIGAEIPGPGWVVAATALAAAGAIALYKANSTTDPQDVHAKITNDGLSSFKISEGRNEYIKTGYTTPLPKPVPIDSKHPLYVDPYKISANAVDNTFVAHRGIIPTKPPAHRPLSLTKIFSQAAYDYGRTNGRPAFDKIVNGYVGSVSDINTSYSANKFFMPVRKRLVDAEEKQDAIAKGNRMKQILSSKNRQDQIVTSPTVNLTINGPLINNFSIHTKNINEAYDKVKEEVTKVLIDMFHHKIAV